MFLELPPIIPEVVEFEVIDEEPSLPAASVPGGFLQQNMQQGNSCIIAYLWQKQQ